MKHRIAKYRGSSSSLRIPDGVVIVALITLGVSDEVSPRSTKGIKEIAFSEAYGVPLG